MSATSSDITERWASLLVEEFVRCGVDRAVAGPGSRSTPLIAACVRNERMRLSMHVDERAAAFYAIGVARATGRPGLWITTSGTAAANGLPAVVESSVDGVPLILVTADRPPELRDTSANQTVPQPDMFAPYVRWRTDLPVPDERIDPAFVLTTVDQAVYRATGVHAGPVHVNAMFRKPLEPGGLDRTDGPERWTSDGLPFTRYAPAEADPDVAPLVRDLQRAQRPALLAGRLTPEQAVSVELLAAQTGWPVFADVLSQLRLGPGPHIRHGELLSARADALPAPDLVLEFGRPGVSPRLRSALLSRATVHAVVADGPTRIDPEHRSSHRLEGIRRAAASIGAANMPSPDGWADAWRNADRQMGIVLEERFGMAELDEHAAAWHLATLVVEGDGLVAASSLPVRHLNLVGGPGLRPGPVVANRGASGIDGTVATAAGLADGIGRPVTALIGDLALLHDLNALALLRERPVTVVVVNNDGGGIFSHLPIAEHPTLLDPWFTTPHGLTFASAAAMFGLRYEAPGDVPAFRQAYADVVRSDRGTVIEIACDRDRTRAVHDELLVLARNATPRA